MSNEAAREELSNILYCKPFPYGGAGAYMRPDANASYGMAEAILAAGYRKPAILGYVLVSPQGSLRNESQYRERAEAQSEADWLNSSRWDNNTDEYRVAEIVEAKP